MPPHCVPFRPALQSVSPTGRAGLLLALLLTGCGSGGQSTPGPDPTPTASYRITSVPAPPAASLALTACEASGQGIDYPVGLGKTYTSLDAVPWERLQAGDTVRIFYSATPYKGKFAVFGQGTAAAPIRIWARTTSGR